MQGIKFPGQILVKRKLQENNFQRGMNSKAQFSVTKVSNTKMSETKFYKSTISCTIISKRRIFNIQIKNFQQKNFQVNGSRQYFLNVKKFRNRYVNKKLSKSSKLKKK